MDNHEIVIDPESSSNTTPLPLSSQTHERDTEVSTWSKPLYDAIWADNWNAIKQILERVPELINGPIGEDNETPLVEAIKRQYWRRGSTRVVRNLIDMMPLVYTKEEISMSGINWAVRYGNYSAVKLLMLKYPAMFNSLDNSGNTPIQTALYLSVSKEMASYLLKLGLSHVQEQDMQEFELTLKNGLEYAIKERYYDFACILLKQYPKVALHESPWKVFTEECPDFPCRSRFTMWQSIMYRWIQIDEKIISKSLTRRWEDANTRFISTDAEMQSTNHDYSQVLPNATVFSIIWVIIKALAWELIAYPIKSVGRMKRRHHQVLGLVRGLCKEIMKFNEQDRINTLQRVFCSAVENGMSDIIEVILQMFPEAIEYKDEEGNNAFQFAASHRDGKTFHLVHKHMKFHMRYILSSIDNDGNNILHLVAKRARRNKLGSGSGEVLQLQHEFQWYKAMEKLLPDNLKFKRNLAKKVPFEVFDEEHRDMLKSESDWITSMANSCMVAGSLIAAVVFAAAITVPGGNNDNGFPNFSNDGAFNVFAISDAVALVFSLIAVVTFLSIFTTRFSTENFQYDLPNRLIIGLISLLVSVTSMMIAFSATVYLLFAKDYNRIIYPTVVVSLVPVLFFAYLQLPSLLNVIKSTYGRNIFKDDNVTVFS